MESQKLANSSSGHESHGVHVCHKCGWPFPNSHPSSKRRRAHKKVCGSIEGYKLSVDALEGTAVSNISIDEDHKPSLNLKVSEASEAGEFLPNRSTDEVFSDAVSEFVEGRGAKPVGESAVCVNGSDVISSVDCGPVAEAVKPPSTTTDSIQVQHWETPENASNILTKAMESSGPSVSDCQTEQKDVLLESEKTKVVDVVYDSSSTSAEQGTHTEMNKEIVSDSNSLDVKVSPSEVTVATAEVIESLPEKLPEDDFVCPKDHKSEVLAEVQSIEHAVPDSRDVSVGINSDYVTEKNGEVGADVQLVSVSDDIHKVDDPKIMLEEFKDHKVLNFPQSATSEFELSEDKGDESKGLVLEVSCPSSQSESKAGSAPTSDVLVKDVAVEEEADSSHISESQGSDREVITPHQMDKIAYESSLAEKECNNISSEDRTVQPILIVDDNHHEKTTNSVIAGDHSSEAGIEDDDTEKPVNLPESDFSASENHVVVACEPAEKASGLRADPETYLNDVGKCEKIETEKDDMTGDARDSAIGYVKHETGVDSSDGPTADGSAENVLVTPEPCIKLTEENIIGDHGVKTVKDSPMQTPESATHLQVSQTVEENVTVSDAHLGKEKPDGNDELQEVTPVVSSVGNQVQGRSLSPSDAELSVQFSSAAEGNSAKESNVSVFGSESFQGESDKQQLGSSVMDLSVDSSSRTDSLENNWGSVSVLSLQSDAQAVLDAETVSPNESRVAIQEKNNTKQEQHPEKSDMFEPPSFMTLVEPKGETNQKSSTSEHQPSQNPQQPNASSLQAGWFPSITHTAQESQGRKKNEEIIAKVTNWSAGGKQHTPLKNLLGEASLETRAKSPKHKDVAQKGNKSTTTVNSILAPESPLGRSGGKEIGREWESPARYQTEIKREKRKPRSRPYWAQFMCCSSVH